MPMAMAHTLEQKLQAGQESVPICRVKQGHNVSSTYTYKGRGRDGKQPGEEKAGGVRVECSSTVQSTHPRARSALL